MWKPRRAILSVSDKTNIVEFAEFLIGKDVEIISTGGTAKLLQENGIFYIPIEEITKKPESFGGRMKSISFELASGILYRRNHETDERQLTSLGILPVDMVVCNLYPFTYNLNQNLADEEMVELIDVGGPTMIRAAAKNFNDVLIVSQVNDYGSLMEEWQQKNEISLITRKTMAQKAFFLLSQYDETIALELSRRFNIAAIPSIPNETESLRYGENPHQKSWSTSLANYQFKDGSYDRKQWQGKELSYNNFLDMDQAHKCVSDLHEYLPAHLKHAVIVKHGNPCGIASHVDGAIALKESFECDAVSAFGGIVSLNFTVDESMANFLSNHFFEVIIAPTFTVEALEVLKKKKNLRLVTIPMKKKHSQELTLRSVLGMKLWQQEDENFPDFEYQEVTTAKMKLTNSLLIPFGIIATKYLKSNAIGLYYENNGALLIASSGVGQPNRIDCLTRLAAPKAEERNIDLGKTLLVSDAFFPFDDMVKAAHACGIKYIIQPGGSLRDPEVIESCNQLNMAMAFTNVRHFRH